MYLSTYLVLNAHCMPVNKDRLDHYSEAQGVDRG